MSGNVPPAPAGGEGDPFAAPSPYQVTPAVADPAAAFEANQDDALVLADPGLRLLGYVADMTFMFGPPFLALLFLDVSRPMDSGAEPTLMDMILFSFIGGWVFVYIAALLVLVSTRGQSPGKMLVGTRIVIHRTGETAGFVNGILLRNVVAGLPASIPCLGWIYLLIDYCFVFQSGHRALHDLIGGTSVIKVPKVEKLEDEMVR